MQAMERARAHLPEVVRTYMRVLRISQEQLGAALGFTQRQISRRLTVPGSLSGDEVAALAAFFGVEVTSLYKAVPDALSDLLQSSDRFRQGVDEAAGPDTVSRAKGAYVSSPDYLRSDELARVA